MTTAPAPTVRSRLRAAGLSDERIDEWLAKEPGSVRLDGEACTDADAPAAPPARITLH